MNANLEAVQVSGNELVVFTYEEFGGMVGETHMVFGAILVNMQTGEHTELCYDNLKLIYNTLKGKQLRLDFWMLMKQRSPEYQALCDEETTRDAIRRVI